MISIDSNTVGLSYAEELSIGVLPGTSQQDGVWYPLEPNEYDDFGAEVSTVARNPINPSRQRRKGVVTDLEASGGFQQDLTNSNLTRLMQGFFFADAYERVRTKPLNSKTANTTVVATFVATGSKINVDDGAKFKVGMILKSTGFVNTTNNQNEMVVSSITTNELTVTGTLVDETYSVGTLEVVGFQYGSADLKVAYAFNVLKLTSVVGFATHLYKVGEWIFIGGDLAANKFEEGGSGQNKPGYARVEKVEANALTLKEPTFTPLTDAGTGKTVRVYTGAYIRNEDTTSLIKKRSYQIERTLGSDNDGVQSEVLVGSVPNELSINFTSGDKLETSLSFVAINNELRSGSTGLKPGDRTNVISEDEAYNSAVDVYRLRLFVYGANPTPASLFAYVTDASISISNGAAGRKAIGTLGSIDISVGDFEVGGELEVYFADIDAVNAVKNNADVGFNTIIASKNNGIVYDIPLLSLGGGRVSVEKDEPIMLPLQTMAARNQNGYTMSATYFSYLPNVAMPTE